MYTFRLDQGPTLAKTEKQLEWNLLKSIAPEEKNQTTFNLQHKENTGHTMEETGSFLLLGYGKNLVNQ